MSDMWRNLLRAKVLWPDEQAAERIAAMEIARRFALRWQDESAARTKGATNG